MFFSTDHVFDGTQAPYLESDPVNPINAYARSKVEAEVSLRELVADRHLIIRTSWLYGPDEQRKNFPLRLVDRGRAGERVRVPADQWGSPTYTEDLARATVVLVERGQTGTFHATGPDFVSRAAFAQQICATFGLDAGASVPTPTRELGQAAPRPLRPRLDCRKLAAAGVTPFRGVAEGLAALREWDAASLVTTP